MGKKRSLLAQLKVWRTKNSTMLGSGAESLVEKK
jgi:hypothetical protein